jgi:hypothetical protein
MRLAPASPFIRYAALAVAIIAVTAWVPGDPSYAEQGSGSAGTAVVATVLVLACLLTRARLSWYIAAVLDGMGLAVFGAVFLLEVADGFDAFKPLALTLLAGLQIGVLFSQGFDDWLRRREVAPA